MNKPLILIVEDDKAVRNLMGTTLDMQEYRYHMAKNGAQALMEAVSQRPDVIILDLGLPDMDGVDLIKKVRSWSNVPIIVVSARSEDADKVNALDAGADDYLTKPFSVEELLARLRASLRRAMYQSSGGMEDNAVFVNGDLKIDYASGCVFIREEEVHLTPIEYKLLCLLADDSILFPRVSKLDHPVLGYDANVSVFRFVGYGVVYGYGLRAIVDNCSLKYTAAVFSGSEGLLHH